MAGENMQWIPFLRSLGLTVSSLALLLAAGCFQPAGSGSESINIAAQPTFTSSPPPAIPTDTPEPKLTDAPEFPLATNTLPPLIINTQPPAIVQVPTSTSFIAPTIDPALLGAPTQAPLQIAQANPFELTATFIVGQATNQAALPLTQTAQAVFGGPTATTGGLFPALTPTVGGATLVPGTGACQHTVARGENLYRISLRYNTTVDALASANGIANINVIREGAVLNIPGCGTGTTPGQTTPPTSSTGCTRRHVVLQNETMYEISLQYGVLVNDIATCSGISNINLIFIGQELSLP
jgi:LysM repeat protein